MFILALIGCFLIAFASTALLVPLVRGLAHKRGWVDTPDGHRKLHKEATPAVGGIAIVIGFVLGFSCLLLAQPLLGIEIHFPTGAVWLGAFIIFLSGLYDDTRGLGFKGKLAIQVVVAYMLLHAGYRIDISALPFIELDVYDQALYSIPLTVLWIVGVINAVNLLDGVDGLAAGVVLIAFVFLATIFGLQGELSLVVTAVAIGGALVGFLLYNFNPASIFMGDSGSLFLGFLLAMYSLEGKVIDADPWLAVLVPIVALGLPLLDTSLSIVRRVLERKAICAPDHDHIHHRMTNIFPTRRAVLLLYGTSLCFGIMAVLMSILSPPLAYTVLAGAIVLIGFGLTMLGYIRWDVFTSESDHSLAEFISGNNFKIPNKSQGDGQMGAVPAFAVVEKTGQLDSEGAGETKEIVRRAGSYDSDFDVSVGTYEPDLVGST